MKHRKSPKPVNGRSADLSVPAGSHALAHAAMLKSALDLHQKGRFDEAGALYKEILHIEPNHFDALQLSGIIAAQTKNSLQAVELFDRALVIQPDNPSLHNNLGNALKELSRYEDALLSYERAVAHKPDYAEAYYNRGLVLKELRRYDEALLSYEKAVTLKPDYAEAYYNHGNVLMEQNRYEEALSGYDKAVSLKPDYAKAYSNRGNALQKLKHYEEALLSYDKATGLQPDYAEAYNNRGVVLHELKRYEDALLSYDRVIALKPDYAEAYINLGNALQGLTRYEDALLSYEKALALKPDYAEAYCNRGLTLHELKQYEDALLNYEKALALKPDYAEAYNNRGGTLHELKRYEEALESYEKALSFRPDYDFLFGEYLHKKMKICDWSTYNDNVNRLTQKIALHEKASFPFPVLALIDSLSLQKEAAEIFIQDKFPADHELPIIPRRQRHARILIGYYSADYHNHATTSLMAELFEKHDRRKFELIAFSFGPDKHDGMRKRVVSAFDRFIDVRTLSDRDIAQLSRDMEVDIAVDLKGFTSDSRTGIFPLRAAPVQVNYLGYPGTMGAEYIDYLIADATLIPESSRQYYTEKIVYLPDSYQVNDAKRCIAEKVFSRTELGLPETGFVFCCFNNNYKITPATFDGWMRILKQTEGSVLWLLEDNPKAAENLRREAVDRGVDEKRLVFAKRMPLAEHLARHRAADLFLDTIPCNAHTTASDALWAGLPVLTLTGESFASRVAASLLNAIELPELITSTQREYEALAVELAGSPEKSAQIRRKLEQNRPTAPLFDIERFTRHIEEAYIAMYERYQADLPPDYIYSSSPSPRNIEIQRNTAQKHDHDVPARSLKASSTVLNYPAQLQKALELHKKGNLSEAEAIYKRILLSRPEHFDAIRLLATIAAQRRRYPEAVELFDLALKINSAHSSSLNNRGVALKELKRYEEALESYDKAIAINPEYADAFSNRGNALKKMRRNEEALLSYGRAVALQPDNAEAYYNIGNVLQELKRYEEAVTNYDKSIQVKSDYAEAYYYRGVALRRLKKYEEAMWNYDKAIALKPDYAEAYMSHGNALTDLNRYEDALLSYEKVIALKPDYAVAHINRGIALKMLKCYEDALLSYDKALSLRPDYDFLFGERLHTKMLICDWSMYDNNVNLLTQKIALHEKASSPFPVLAIIDSPFLQQEAALIYVQDKFPADPELPIIPGRQRHERIRIGYYSADYHDHATAYLMAELFEKHDRRKFELIAFSFGPDKHDGMRKRVVSAFDRFIDVRTLSDRDIAQLSRDMAVDIAVDLKGFTTENRTGIFALRAAPVQVNYLGYPGTMGAEYIDYLIADRTLIPESSLKYYTEKIVTLPDCYQVNDAKRCIAEKVFSRTELGLPETGFVFCCFNNNYKITPPTFDGWMRILKQAEGSVLWLLEDNPKAAENLRREAVNRGVDEKRLVFAKRMPLSEHLARHRMADLFLDTFPYNAHTTASDALWTGLPLLTLTGESFASRVAASLLNAIELPELITSTQREYEALAVELVANPEKSAQIRRKLEQNRLTTPLFDTERFTRHIEEAYIAMYERYQADLPPDHIFPLSLLQRNTENNQFSMKDCEPQMLKHEHTVSTPSASADTAKMQSALMLHQQGLYSAAEAIYNEILRIEPNHFDALQLSGIIAAQTKNSLEAVELFDRALVIQPDNPSLHNNLGNALKELSRYEDALLSYERAVEIKPDYVEAYYNRGLLLNELRRYEEALLSYKKALALKPDYAEAYYNHGNVLIELKRYEEALSSYAKAITFKPDYPGAYCNQGNALAKLNRQEDAVSSFKRVIALKPENAEAYYNLCVVLHELKRYTEALAGYDKALLLKPDYDFLFGERLHTKMLICDWSTYDNNVNLLTQKIVLHEKASFPFPVLALTDSLSLQKETAEIFIQEKYPPDHELHLIPGRQRHARIRIGYYSADYHDHATAYLMAELFEKHDRRRFELIAFSFGPDSQDGMRKRIVAAFDRFIEVRTLSDRDIAQLSRNMEVDIAVDLKGFTTESRTGIFALRAAPVQVNYLGYPGTMGAEYIDYLIADATLIPESSRQYYTEKIVYLPDSYQVNDAKRCIAEKVFSRTELGLPETGFVFCCFNNNYKITPATFDGWMRILKQADGSVLWLFEDNPKAAENLRREAVDRGVDEKRLVFARRMPLPEHLARHRAADLFLDTIPCNAHTTASDALWAGLPVLTLTGESFASRVAASLLNAIELPELITSTQREYEALAVELAADPEKLMHIRHKLERNRLTTALFDIERFTRHIEAAYIAMYDRYQADLPPDHIVVTSF